MTAHPEVLFACVYDIFLVLVSFVLNGARFSSRDENQPSSWSDKAVFSLRRGGSSEW